MKCECQFCNRPKKKWHVDVICAVVCFVRNSVLVVPGVCVDSCSMCSPPSYAGPVADLHVLVPYTRLPGNLGGSTWHNIFLNLHCAQRRPSAAHFGVLDGGFISLLWNRRNLKVHHAYTTQNSSVLHTQPKSKRNKVVSLTRTDKQGYQAKTALVEEVHTRPVCLLALSMLNRHRLSCSVLYLFSLFLLLIYTVYDTPPSLDCRRKMLPPIHPSTIPPSCYRLSRFPSCRRRQTGRTLNFTRRVFPTLVCIGYTADTDIVNHSPKLYYFSPHNFYFLDPPCTRVPASCSSSCCFFPFPSSSSHLFPSPFRHPPTYPSTLLRHSLCGCRLRSV